MLGGLASPPALPRYSPPGGRAELPAADEMPRGRQRVIQMILSGGGRLPAGAEGRAGAGAGRCCLVELMLKAVGAIGLMETLCGPAFAR